MPRDQHESPTHPQQSSDHHPGTASCARGRRRSRPRGPGRPSSCGSPTRSPGLRWSSPCVSNTSARRRLELLPPPVELPRGHGLEHRMHLFRRRLAADVHEAGGRLRRGPELGLTAVMASRSSLGAWAQERDAQELSTDLPVETIDNAPQPFGDQRVVGTSRSELHAGSQRLPVQLPWGSCRNYVT